MLKRFAIIATLLVLLVPTLTALAQPPQQVLDALNDLSRRIGTQLQISDLSGWSYEQAFYPDTSLGCPKAGQTYSAVRTSGYSVNMTYNDVDYNYRVSADRTILFLCSPDSGASPAATATLAPTPTPVATAQPAQQQVLPAQPQVAPAQQGVVACPGAMPARLAVGGQGQSIATGSVNIRSTPGLGADTVIGLLLPGGTFIVLDGPRCASNQTWWKINYIGRTGTSTVGWVMEGDASTSDYWLVPFGVQPTPVPTAAPAVAVVGSGQVITTANAGQLQFPTTVTLPEAMDGAALFPEPLPDVLMITQSGKLMHLSGTTTQDIGHPGSTVLEAAVGMGSDGFIKIVAAETTPTTTALWVRNIPSEGAAMPVDVYGIQLPQATVNDVAISPDGRYFAASSGTWLVTEPTTPNAVWVWEISGGAQIATLMQTAPATNLVFSPDGSLLAVGDSDGTVHLWTLATQAETATIPDTASFLLTPHLAFSPDGKTLAIGLENGQVMLWDVATNAALSAIQIPRGTVDLDYPVQCVAFSADGTLLITSSGTLSSFEMTEQIYVWDVATGTQLAALPLAEVDHVNRVSFSHDGTQLWMLGMRTWQRWSLG